jgi:hypothetical protein
MNEDIANNEVYANLIYVFYIEHLQGRICI